MNFFLNQIKDALFFSLRDAPEFPDGRGAHVLECSVVYAELYGAKGHWVSEANQKVYKLPDKRRTERWNSQSPAKVGASGTVE